MADSKIKWKIDIEGVDNLSNKLNNIDKNVEKANAGILNMVAVYQATTMAVNQLSSAYKRLETEFIQSDEATTRLNNTLKITGQFTQQASDGLDAYAGQMEAVLGVQAEVVKDALSFNMALGANADQAQQMTSAAGALAKALKMDVRTANEQLAGTLNGNVGRLGRLIPEFRNLTKSQLESGEAINIVNRRFKEYLINTNSASELLKQQKIALDDIVKSVAEGLFNSDGSTDVLKQVVAALRAINTSGTAMQIGAVFKDLVMLTVSGSKLMFGSLEVFYDSIIGKIERIYYTLAEGIYRIRALLPNTIGGNGKEDLNKAEEYRQKMLASQREVFENQNATFELTNKFGESFKSLTNNAVKFKDNAATITTEYQKQLGLLEKQATVQTSNIAIEKDFDPQNIINVTQAINGGLSSIISMIGKAYGVIGEAIAGVINFLNQTREQMTAFIDGLIDAIIQLPENIINSIDVIVNRVLERIPEMISRLLPTLAVGFFRVVLNMMTAMVKAIPNLLKSFLNINFWMGIAKDMATSLFSAFKGFFQALFFGKGSESITSVIEKGGQLFNPTENAGKELFKIKDYAEGQVVQTFEDRVNTVTTAASKGLIQELFDALAGIGTAIWDGLKSALSAAWDWLKGIGTRIWEGIKDGLSSIFDFGGGGGGGLWDSVTGAVSSVGDSIANVFGWAEGGLVGGNAPFLGNDYRNDTVPALLSAGEYVVSRDEMRTGDFSGLYAASGKGGNSMSVAVNINVGSGSTLTEQQLRTNVVPVIVSELRKLSQNGTQIVNKKGIY